MSVETRYSKLPPKLWDLQDILLLLPIKLIQWACQLPGQETDPQEAVPETLRSSNMPLKKCNSAQWSLWSLLTLTLESVSGFILSSTLHTVSPLNSPGREHRTRGSRGGHRTDQKGKQLCKRASEGSISLKRAGAATQVQAGPRKARPRAKHHRGFCHFNCLSSTQLRVTILGPSRLITPTDPKEKADLRKASDV